MHLFKNRLIVVIAAITITVLLALYHPSKTLSAALPPFNLPTEGFLGVCWNDSGFRHIYEGVSYNHTGIDVWSDKDVWNGSNKDRGKPVYAVYGGKVVTVNRDVGRVQIELDELPEDYNGVPGIEQTKGLYAYYTHMEQIFVEEGNRVEKGQNIGKQGNRSKDTSMTIVHLHFSLKRGLATEEVVANTLDPSPYLGMKLKYPDCGYNTKMWMAEFRRDTTPPAPRVDLAFVIDTTGSMWDDIGAAKANATSYINAFKDSLDLRIAVVAFRDFPVSPYGGGGDYPYLDIQQFTSDRSKAISAIQSLSAGGGADTPESSYCALLHVMRGDKCAGRGSNTTIGEWRPSSTKGIIWMTDALPHSPEPFTGFTANDVITTAIKNRVLLIGGGEGEESGPPEGSDPINVFAIPVGTDPSVIAEATAIAEQTGGKAFSAPTADDVVNAILKAIGEIGEPTNQPPVANAGQDQVIACSGNPTTQVKLDGTKSSDPDGDSLTYSWSALGITFDDSNSSTPTSNLPYGTTTVTLEVNDGKISSIDTVLVEVKPCILINNGDEFTNNIKVVLELSYPENTTLMRLSNMPFKKNDKHYPRWQGVAPILNWKLFGRLGKRSVYVQYKNKDGSVSDVYSDDIILDILKPIPYKIEINGGSISTNNPHVKIKIYAFEKNSGIQEMKISNTKNFSNDDWKPFQEQFEWDLISLNGNKPQVRHVYVRLKDKAQNISPVMQGVIMLIP